MSQKHCAKISVLDEIHRFLKFVDFGSSSLTRVRRFYVLGRLQWCDWDGACFLWCSKVEAVQPPRFGPIVGSSSLVPGSALVSVLSRNPPFDTPRTGNPQPREKEISPSYVTRLIPPTALRLVSPQRFYNHED